MKCHAPVGLALVLAIMFSVTLNPTNATATEPPVAERVKAIKDEFQKQRLAAVEALRSAKTQEEGFKLYREKQPSPARCVERLLSLARTDPRGSDGFEALVAAAEFSDIAWNWKDESVRRNDVIKLLADNHVENPMVGETFRWLKDLHTQSARDLMRQAAKRNPSRMARGMAVFFLAADLEGNARLIEIFREVPSFKADLERANGNDSVAALAQADPKALRQEAIGLLAQAQNEYGDVKIDDKPIRDQTDHILFRLRRLDIAQVAPEIVGTDQDGRPMKLSDYRGKVVAIVFWGSWCGVCMHSIPGERDLVIQMQGKPFVLLGVNSDPPERLASIIQKHQINWRSWADGELDGPQPIARAWNVTSWPKIYLLDAAGVIRYTELAHGSSDDLERAVGALVSQASQ